MIAGLDLKALHRLLAKFFADSAAVWSFVALLVLATSSPKTSERHPPAFFRSAHNLLELSMSEVDPQSSASRSSRSPSSGARSAASAAERTPVDENVVKALQECRTDRKDKSHEVELYRNRCNADKSELYQLLGFYSVFQSVVFNTVATSVKLTCQTSVLPALVSFLASVAALYCVYFKFIDYELNNGKLIKAVEQLAGIDRKKVFLKKRNPKLIMNEEDLEIKLQEVAKSKNQTKKLEEAAHTHRIYYWSVTVFLFCFSIVIVACCFLIRCWDFDARTIMICFFQFCHVKHNV